MRKNLLLLFILMYCCVGCHKDSLSVINNYEVNSDKVSSVETLIRYINNEYIYTTRAVFESDSTSESQEWKQIVSADAQGAEEGAKKGIEEGISIGGTEGFSGAIAGSLIGCICGSVVYGASASYLAWKDITESVSLAYNAEITSGFSMYNILGENYFWESGRIDLVDPINDILYEYNSTNPIEQIGVMHNQLINYSFHTRSRQLLGLRERTDIKTNMQNLFIDSLYNLLLNNVDDFEISANKSATNEEDLNHTLHQCKDIYFSIDKYSRESYYEQLMGWLSYYFSNDSTNLDYLLSIAYLSTLYHSSNLWKEITPAQEKDNAILLLDFHEQSATWTSDLSVTLDSLLEYNNKCCVAVPVFERGKLDRIYIFASLFDRNREFLLSLAQDLKEQSIYIPTISIQNNNILSGQYHFSWNKDFSALCVFLSDDSQIKTE